MKLVNKIFIFTSTINGCQSLSGLHTTLVNVKKLVNPDRGLSTHKRPEKSKGVEVNRQGSLVLKCLHVAPDFNSTSPEYIITGSHQSTHQYNLLAHATKVSITNKQGGATSSLKPSDKISDRQPEGLKYSFFLSGGRGKLLFLRSLISFSPACCLTLNSLAS